MRRRERPTIDSVFGQQRSIDIEAALRALSEADQTVKTVFTTGEVAQVCQISQQTVIRCFDAGRLKGFRVPGSKFRRITRDALIEFMKDNSIPLDRLESGKYRVLIVDDDAGVVDMLKDLLTRDGRFDVRTAATGYDAGLITAQFRPDIVLLDFMLPDINGHAICKRIRENPELTRTKIIIISGVARQSDIDLLLGAGADAFFKKPFDINLLVEKMANLVTA